MLKLNKYIPYVIAILCLYIAGLHIYISQNECAEIIDQVVVHDTIYKELPPKEIQSSPKIVYVTKHDTIIKYLQGGTDTLLKFVHKPSGKTFEQTDTLKHEGQQVIINDRGNCLGVQDRKAIWSGKRSIITKTITNTISQPPSVFSLYGGVQGQYIDTSITDIQPSLLLIFKQKFGVEYSYGVLQNSHNVGLKFKIK